jgi:hypothetical protein
MSQAMNRIPMHLRIFVLSMLAVPAASSSAQQKANNPTSQDIVAAADQVRNPDQPFRLTTTLVEYVKGQPRDRVILVVYARED